MLNDMKQFVPQEVCLSCDGCCRFKEENSPWRPKVTAAELQGPIQQGLAERILAHSTAQGHIKTVSCGGQHICSFLNPQNNTCGIYPGRPFECQLYPFVLVRGKDETVGVCVHLNCPYIQESRSTKEFEEYVRYLREFFNRRDVRDFLHNNPSLGGDYAQYAKELEELFIIA